MHLSLIGICPVFFLRTDNSKSLMSPEEVVAELSFSCQMSLPPFAVTNSLPCISTIIISFDSIATGPAQQLLAANIFSVLKTFSDYFLCIRDRKSVV